MTVNLTDRANELKNRLASIRENDFAVPEGTDAYEIAFEILDHLDSLDPELRDNLGMTTLGRWIYVQDRFTPEQLRAMLERVLREDLYFNGIGEVEGERVFLRSFCSLTLALMVARDNKNAFLTEDELRSVMAQVLRYCREELDLRGFHPDYGWAHAAAHVADVVDELVKSRYVTAADCLALWDGLQALVAHAPTVFSFEEDERIAFPLWAMLAEGKADVATIAGWLKNALPEKKSVSYDRFLIHKTNLKHVTRSLYFRLRKENLLSEEAEAQLRGVQDEFASL
ncbi:MAG TPA: DUF2785 domain-containing protein [Bacilli bacterium]|nr:DUF2785 domain-containing protein [Bacilli bacterium]